MADERGRVELLPRSQAAAGRRIGHYVAATAGRSGRRTVNTAPPAAPLPARTWPLWVTTNFWTSARPSPVPSARVVKNGLEQPIAVAVGQTRAVVGHGHASPSRRPRPPRRARRRGARCRRRGRPRGRCAPGSKTPAAAARHRRRPRRTGPRRSRARPSGSTSADRRAARPARDRAAGATPARAGRSSGSSSPARRAPGSRPGGRWHRSDCGAGSAAGSSRRA